MDAIIQDKDKTIALQAKKIEELSSENRAMEQEIAVLNRKIERWEIRNLDRLINPGGQQKKQ